MVSVRQVFVSDIYDSRFYRTSDYEIFISSVEFAILLVVFSKTSGDFLGLINVLNSAKLCVIAWMMFNLYSNITTIFL